MAIVNYPSYSETETETNQIPLSPEAIDDTPKTTNDLSTNSFVLRHGVPLVEKIENSNAFSSYFNQGITDAFIDKPKYFDGDDVISHLRKQQSALLSAGAISQILQTNEFTDFDRENYAKLKTMFDNVGPEGFTEWVDAILSNTGHVLNDPATYVGGGIGALGIKGLIKLAQVSNNPLLRKAAAKYVGTGYTGFASQGTASGLIYGGITNVGQQNLNLAVGLQDEFKHGDFALETGIGGVTGGLLGAGLRGIPDVASKTRNLFKNDNDQKVFNKTIDEEVVHNNIKNDTGEPLQDSIVIEAIPYIQSKETKVYYDTSEEFIEAALPVEGPSRWQQKRAKESSKKTRLEEKEERLYGGFMTEEMIMQASKDYNVNPNEIIENALDYEASRDIPSIEDVSDMAFYYEVDQSPFIPRSWNDEYKNIYKDHNALNSSRTFREKSMRNFRDHMDAKKQAKEEKKLKRQKQKDALLKKEQAERPNPFVIEPINYTPPKYDHYDAIIDMARDLDYVDPPKQSLNAGQKFSDDIGGGNQVAEEAADIHQQVNTGQITPDTARARLSKAIQRIHGKYLFGKPTKILTQFLNDSKIATDLAARIRYDANKTYSSDSEAVNFDYNETYKEYAGGLYSSFMRTLETIRPFMKGKGKDTTFELLSRALRGERSEFDEINAAADEIRINIFNKVAEDSDRLNINPDVDLNNYFPRLWDRSAIVKDFYGTKFEPILDKGKYAGQGEMKLAKMLLEDGQAESEEKAFNIVVDMLNKKGGVLHSSGNSFFTKRIFDKIKDDNKYSEFLDNDISNVIYNYITQAAGTHAKKTVLGVDNIAQFEKMWVDKIAEEVTSKRGGNAFTTSDRKQILHLYKTVTGEELEDFGPAGQFIRDGYVMLTRMATLPLSTVSSLTEVLINVQKAGLGQTAKGMGFALNQGTKWLTTSLADKLMKKHNLSRPEAVNEMREFFFFVDNAAVSSVDRLADASIANRTMQNINNKFFKIVLLDGWTRFVQLASYSAGKSLIHKNLKMIADHGNLAPSKRIKLARDQLTELNVDIDQGLNYLKRNDGEINVDDAFYYDIKKGAARYTNEVILDTSGRAAVNSTFINNPMFTAFTQLMGYPAAFTNVVLKNFVRGLKNPYSTPDTIAAALMMTAGASGLNYVRTGGEGYDEKNAAQIAGEGLARWGGNGIILDQMQRVSKTYDITGGDAPTTALSALGVAGQDFVRLRYIGPGSVLATKAPGYGAYKTVFGKDFKDKYDDVTGIRKVYRTDYREGGEVKDVQNVIENPEDRIDPYTNLPYSDTYEERTKYVLGGLIGSLSRTITKALTRKGIRPDPDMVKRVADEIEEGVYHHNDPDVPTDPLMEEYVNRATRSLIDEKHDKNLVDIKEEFPEFFDPQGRLQGSEEFSRARGYFEDQIDNFQKEGELENKMISGQDYRNYIQEKLLTIPGAINNTDYTLKNYKNYLNEKINLGTEKWFLNENRGTVKDYLKKLPEIKKDSKNMSNKIIASLDAEERRMLQTFGSQLPILPKAGLDPLYLNLTKKEKKENLERFLKDSKEKKIFFRTTRDGFDFEWQESVIMPFETGMHIGTQKQAEFIAGRHMGVIRMAEEAMNLSGKQITQRFQRPIPKDISARTFNTTMFRGYISVKNPLVIDKDFGDWRAENYLTEREQLAYLLDAIKEQSNISDEVVDEGIGKLYVEAGKYIRWFQRQDQLIPELSKDGGEASFIFKQKDQIRRAYINNLTKRFFQSMGFDSIAYKNTFETPKKSKQEYSYILFEPNQFKNISAEEFDIEDPRFNVRTGGLLKSLKKKVQVNG